MENPAPGAVASGWVAGPPGLPLPAPMAGSPGAFSDLRLTFDVPKSLGDELEVLIRSINHQQMSVWQFQRDSQLRAINRYCRP